ncbi:MAG: hypothetical protein AAFO95_08225 [Cyanobacteria bacterium J06600_6]
MSRLGSDVTCIVKQKHLIIWRSPHKFNELNLTLSVVRVHNSSALHSSRWLTTLAKLFDYLNFLTKDS